MPTPNSGNLPVIGTISDPAKTRIALVQGQQIVSAPATALSDAIGVPSGGTTGQVLTKSSETDYDSGWADASGGDFTGPSSSIDGNLVAFDGTTGKLGKDSGKKPADFATAAQGALANTAVQPADLASVATSGDYDDLSGAPTIREVLTAARTYYVRSDGSDSNDGLSNTSGGAFLTIGKAVNVVGGLDLSIYNVTIQVADGTWNENVVLKSYVGAGVPTLQGNPTTPGNCIINGSTGVPISYLDGRAATWQVNGFQLTGSSVALNLSNCSLKWANIDLATTGYTHIQAFDAAICSAYGNYSVSSSASNHLNISGLAICRVQSRTVTFNGTIAFSAAFAAVATANIVLAGNTYTGTVTGSRYSATLNGVINTGGGGATALPGNAAGTTATGGQYA